MERGGAQRRTAMAAVVCGLDSARDGVDRGRERVEWFRGEVARLWMRGIEAEWRGLAGGTDGGELELVSARREREEGERRSETGDGTATG